MKRIFGVFVREKLKNCFWMNTGEKCEERRKQRETQGRRP